MLNTNRQRLRWRCRRGMRELDVILERFLDQGYDDLNVDCRLAFAALLECQDTDLYAWLTGKAESDDPALRAVIERILAMNKLA